MIDDLQSKKYENIVETMLKNKKIGQFEPHTQTIYTYSLIQIKRYSEASKIKLAEVYDKSYKYILKNIYMGLNRVSVLKFLNLDKPIKQYEIFY